MAAQSVPSRSGEHVDAGDDEVGLPRRTRPLAIGTHRVTKEPAEEAPSAYERVRVSGWLAPTLLAVLALLLVVSAYVVGRAFTGHVAGRGTTREEPRVVMSEGGSSRQKQPVLQQKTRPPGRGRARSCRSPGYGPAPAAPRSRAWTRAAGGSATAPSNLIDGVADTTWRCDGSAVGEKVTLHLGREREVAEVGLIPGYAKTDDSTALTATPRTTGSPRCAGRSAGSSSSRR